MFDQDQDLLGRFRRGDRDALEKIYWAYADSVERFLRRCLFSLGPERTIAAGGTEDLVQDVFTRAFGRAARNAYDGIRDYRPYLFTIARHALVDVLRISRREVLTDHEHLGEHHGQEEADPGNGSPHWDTHTLLRVRYYLAQLPPDLREVHHQRHVLGLSQDAAANALGLSRQRLRTMEKKLRSGLTRFITRKRTSEWTHLPR